MDRWLKEGTLKRAVSENSRSSSSSVPDTSRADGNDGDEETKEFASFQGDNASSGRSNEDKTVRYAKRRKYDESYIGFGFMNADDHPQCVVCSKIFPNSSMAPAKLRRHLETIHQDVKDKNIDFFVRKRDELLKVKKTIFQAAHTVNEKATEASFLVAYQIARAGEAHTIAESLIKPCAIDMVKSMLGEKSAKEIAKIPLSNDTVSRRVKKIAGAVKALLVDRIKSRKFALQMDESTDISGLAILLVFVKYEHETSLTEDLLLCKPLLAHATALEIFNILNSFFEENEIPWENCIDICTDGAKAMVGKTSGVVARIKKVSKNCTSSHCMLHRQALAAKKLPKDLKCTLDEVVKMINFIKSRPLNNRLFKILCDDMGSAHTSLLLHTEVRWLSRGKILERFFELKAEVRVFFTENHFYLEDRLLDNEWLFRVAYLADMFSKLNELNLALQGKQVDVFSTNDKIVAFKRKLQFWISCIRSHELDCFPTMKTFLSELNSEVENKQYEDVIQHLDSLSDSMEQYFPNEQHENLKEQLWVKNPFVINQKPSCFSSDEYEKLIELTSDCSISSLYKTVSVSEFWCRLKGEYPSLSEKALSVLLPFATTYICETGFSAYALTKTKHRNMLDAEHDMGIKFFFNTTEL